MFRYDLLVVDLPSFNATFYAPNRQQSAKSSVRTFEVIVDDIVNRHRIILTSMPSINDANVTVAGGPANVNATFTVAARVSMSPSWSTAGDLAYFTHCCVVAMVATLSLVLLFMLNVAIVQSLNKIQRRTSFVSATATTLPGQTPPIATTLPGQTPPIATVIRPGNNDSPRPDNKTKPSTKWRRCPQQSSSPELCRLLVVVFLTSKIIYCFGLTLTSFSTVFVLLTNLRTDELGNHNTELIGPIRRHLTAAERIVEWTEADLHRSTSSMTVDAHSSVDLCEQHSSDLFESTWSVVITRAAAAIAATGRTTTSSVDGFSSTSQLLERYAYSVDRFGDLVMSRFNEDIRPTIDAAEFRENGALVDNDWLRFAANLFEANSKTSRLTKRSSTTVDPNSWHSRTRFIDFLQIELINLRQNVRENWGDWSANLRSVCVCVCVCD